MRASRNRGQTLTRLPLCIIRLIAIGLEADTKPHHIHPIIIATVTLCGRMGAKTDEHELQMTYQMEYHQDKVSSWAKPKEPRTCWGIKRGTL
ncbi:hypothetical protein P171DRAFT_427773 [Karstenula rhodostoma CBS 690.94]|uniref:Secreted protein n=1 Tax=Karstenula rhodostoma CBS 690.94 TaxID=1392251 RepID=A0A9P4PUK0_9PLEO|nr:hypothetical protein P171DRAFT_427773 [Karstenula rhodostoma CBS 690.94]